MSKLQLKQEHIGKTITRRFVGIGNLVLDTNKLDSRTILNYYRNGFEDLFEYVEDTIETKEVVETFTDLNDDDMLTPSTKPKVEPVVEDEYEYFEAKLLPTKTKAKNIFTKKKK